MGGLFRVVFVHGGLVCLLCQRRGRPVVSLSNAERAEGTFSSSVNLLRCAVGASPFSVIVFVALFFFVGTSFSTITSSSSKALVAVLFDVVDLTLVLFPGFLVVDSDSAFRFKMGSVRFSIASSIRFVSSLIRF